MCVSILQPPAPPDDTERYGVPNPCTSCHADETDEWALDELRRWPQFSPWRVAP